MSVMSPWGKRQHEDCRSSEPGCVCVCVGVCDVCVCLCFCLFVCVFSSFRRELFSYKVVLYYACIQQAQDVDLAGWRESTWTLPPNVL